MNRRRFAVLAVALVAINAFFWLAESGLAVPGGNIIQSIFGGGRLVRADVVWVGPNGVQETQIDRGTLVSVSPGSITLREADGLRTIQISSALNLARLRRGVRVAVAGPAGQPADTIQIEGFRG